MRNLEVEAAREAGEVEEIEGIEGIEGMGEVEAVGVGPTRRKKSDAQNGRMSTTLPPHFHSGLIHQAVLQLTKEHATTSELQNDRR